MLSVLVKTASVLITALFGAFLHKTLLFDLKTLTNLIIYIGSPCLTFYTISQNQYHFRELLFLLVLMCVLFLGSFFLTKIFLAKEVRSNKALYLATCFMNTAGMGFPVTIFLLGEEAFAYAVVLDLAMMLAMFSFGVLLINPQSGVTAPFKLPVIYAAIFGLLFSFYGWQLPEELLQPIRLLSGISVPLLLISLGARLSELKLAKIDLSVPIKATLIRIIGGGLIAVSLSKMFNLPPLVEQVFLLYAVLPSALMAYVLANKYRHNDVVVAETILFSTIISLPVIAVMAIFFCG